MIPENIRTEILTRIKNAEAEHNVKVLYAIESGSRAWGFASPNSDYDVRFVYVHPKEWYLTIDVEDKRDVIEYPIVDEIDINGWDLRKALKLLWRSNPAIVEWRQSPIVYIDDGVFAEAARKLIAQVYSIEKGVYHYRSMAKTNYRGYLKEEIVPIKKYFYVLRPLLSIMWLEQYKQPAPMEFHRLRKLIQHNEVINHEISLLLQRKKISQEKEIAPAIKALNDFIESELARLETLNVDQEDDERSINGLNELFAEILR